MISLIQTAEGALNETHAILQRMRELAVQSANDTNTDGDRAELQKEVDQLSQALTDISEDTEFNTKPLLDGSFTGKFQVGANADQNIEVTISNMSASELGVVGDTSGQLTSTGDIYAVGKSSADIVTAGKISVTVDGGTAQDVAVDSTISTKDDLVKAINDTVTGATASLENGNIVIKSDSTGTSSTIAVTVTEAKDGASTPADVTDLGTMFGGTAVAGQEDVVGKGINIDSQSAANTAITTLDTAIQKVSAERSKLGAVQNRLDHTINNLGTSAENLTAAESRIRDVDYDLAAA